MRRGATTPIEVIRRFVYRLITIYSRHGHPRRIAIELSALAIADKLRFDFSCGNGPGLHR
jgi:hypothetical protein